MALPIGLKPGLKAKTVVNDNDEYAATCLAHAVVYRLNGKAVKTDKVPEEVKAQLHATMLVGAGVPTEEPEFIDEAKDVTPEMIDAIEPVITGGTVIKASTEMGENTFYQGEPAVELQPEINEIAKQLEVVEADETGFSASDATEADYEAMLQEAEARSVDW